MLSPKTLIYRIATVLLIASLAFTSVGCMSLVERLVPQREPAPTSEPPTPEPGTTPVAARPTSRPVPRAERPTGVISTQSAEVVASEVIDTSGGTITVVRPGDPIDGLVLEVPEGSYPDAREFTISSAPIVGHTFGDTFNPLSPLITIENGGDYSDEFMLVTVPIDLPEGWFAMPFYYDEATGTLEGIPFTDLRQDSITVVTAHFSRFTISGILNWHLDGLIAEGIESGFIPGLDDWQFTNRGSYIARGHCAGQALTAMWYYCEHPDGEDQFLWGLYDNNGREPPTPDLWEDDSYGYRFASSVQHQLDQVWLGFENRFFYHLMGRNDEATFKAFAYSTWLTGEPQVIYVYATGGGGHAMVVYRITREGLHIADPNYPGAANRTVRYANATFTPYNSGANAAEIEAGNSINYDLIGYWAKTATVDWNRIAARWQEFRAGTIGNDRFPQYQVLVVHDDDTEEPLVDGYESEHERIRINVSSPGVPIGIRVYRNGQVITPGQDRKYALEEGYNLLGIYIGGDVNRDPTNRRWRYIDFQYFNVWYRPEREIEFGDCGRGLVLQSVDVYQQPRSPGRGSFDFLSYDEGSFAVAYREVGMFWLADEPGAEQFWWAVDHEGSWTVPPTCIPEGRELTFTLSTSTLVSYESMAVQSRAAPSTELRYYAGPRMHREYDRVISVVGHLDDSEPWSRPADQKLEDSATEVFQTNLWSQNWSSSLEEGSIIEIVVDIRPAYGPDAKYTYTYVFQE